MRELSRNWWAIALRGAVAIAFGILAFLFPGITLLALILLFAAFAIVDGIFALVSGLRGREGRRDWWLVVGGLAGIAAGIVAIVAPGLTTTALLLLIAAWAIVTGAFELVAAYQMRRELDREWLLALDGLLSIAFGLFIFFFPGAGALALVWLIAAFAIVSGVMLLVLAFRLRRRNRAAPGVPRGAPSAVA